MNARNFIIKTAKAISEHNAKNLLENSLPFPENYHKKQNDFTQL